MSSSSDPQSMPPPDADFFLNEDHQRLTKNLFLKVIQVPDWVHPQESLAIDFYIPQIQLEHPEWEFEDIPLFMLQAKIKESTDLSPDKYALYKVPVNLRENLNIKYNKNIATFRSMGIAPDNTLIVAKLRRGGGRKRKSRLKKKRTKKRRRKTKRRVKKRRVKKRRQTRRR